jgi:hypothetical protein
MMNSLETMPVAYSLEETASPAWLDSMEQLFVVYRSGSIVMFSHRFDGKVASSQQDDDLHGAAIDAMDMLLGEILSNNGHIRQIVHEDKVLSFSYGRHCSFILISKMHANDVMPHLARFATAFELQFASKLGNHFNIDMDEYQDARALVDANFA